MIDWIIIQQVFITLPSHCAAGALPTLKLGLATWLTFEQEIGADMAEQRLETCFCGLTCSFALCWCL